MLTYLSRRVLGLFPSSSASHSSHSLLSILAPGKPTDFKPTLIPRYHMRPGCGSRSSMASITRSTSNILPGSKRFAMLDFGTSYVDNRPVLRKIAERLPVTLLINIATIALVFFCRHTAGVLSAVRRGSVADRRRRSSLSSVFPRPSSGSRSSG